MEKSKQVTLTLDIILNNMYQIVIFNLKLRKALIYMKIPCVISVTLRSIPHAWYTIEIYNNQQYIETTNNSITNATIIALPNGNYTAPSLATTLTSLLQTRLPEIVVSRN